MPINVEEVLSKYRKTLSNLRYKSFNEIEKDIRNAFSNPQYVELIEKAFSKLNEIGYNFTGQANGEVLDEMENLFPQIKDITYDEGILTLVSVFRQEYNYL